MHELVEQALSLSRADGCMAVARESTDANVRWANNTSTTNGRARHTRLTVVSVVGGRVGAVGISSITPDQVPSLVQRSEEAARTTPPAEDFMPLLDGDGVPADWADPPEPVDIATFAGLAPDLGQAFERAGHDDIRLFGFAEAGSSTCWLGTSTGLRRRHTQGDGLIELNAKTPDFSQSAWVGQARTRFDDVDVDALYARLAQRLQWSATAVPLPAGHYQALLEPSAVGDMLFAAYGAASARDAEEGRSVYSRPGGGTREGERLFPAGLDLWSDPAEPGLETAPFAVTTSSSAHSSVFDNGLPTARTHWVGDGVLQNLVRTRHGAVAAGTEATPWIDNLVLSAGDGPDLDAMIAATDRALLVTCFWYIREVDPRTLLLTGLTRDGVFLVEGGEVKGAVNNFRFNMSPVDLLAQAVEVGGPVPTLPREFGDWFRRVKAPPLRVDRFNMSSVSEAT
ncbi:MAG: metallopeptidase TldD-related protein [Acidimicrobiales bacterium]